MHTESISTNMSMREEERGRGGEGERGRGGGGKRYKHHLHMLQKVHGVEQQLLGNVIFMYLWPCPVQELHAQWVHVHVYTNTK